MCTQPTAIPPTCPPRTIRLIVLEFTGQEDGYEDFVNSPLDENDRNKTKDGMRSIPRFQEPL